MFRFCEEALETCFKHCLFCPLVLKITKKSGLCYLSENPFDLSPYRPHKIAKAVLASESHDFNELITNFHSMQCPVSLILTDRTEQAL